ncbi:MAG: hypothetical protein CGU28_13535 [Candidatus Dactylopiibacterium carminicum]|uniref:Zinc-dependent peptidase n=1 Tax=Candidatus Dactylopiibacterium carminicum TaxID=857335 RepID=A0A272ERH2_9RHOO|nr:hypothetical protein BGI27_11375 [Candidatus Dactylopiibacterium carminicum]PAS92698.1 MAG: hypothetical protein CGU29_10600 [Candidatus Dactylopiibacterium carminicum]PAS94741.1 MAG: hypothetical protein CGU28_13535 [Candidatus Dactylopiibacterium carminicum]PAS98823.1 MAG: hypothetical protein BSR46_11390 [Candidatus Dactylopiibacterium carminicum]
MIQGLRRLLGQRPRAEIPDTEWAAIELPLAPLLAHLDATERAALRILALRFLDSKVFCGAAGFEPDNRVRLSIALQACLPVLKLGLESYAGWRGIIVYPEDFVIPRREIDEDGLLHEYDEEALGEAWPGGPVVLSWFDAPEDYEGAQVVIHEFAHKLDMLNGEADGLPPLHAGIDEGAWYDAFEAAYTDFCKRVDAGEDDLLDPSAADHPAEFFAIASEVFFSDAKALYAQYPEIYAQLSLFYRQDTNTSLQAQALGSHTKI